MRSTALLLIVCLLVSQAPLPSSAQAPSTTVTVPAGTVVPLTLVSQIKNKSSKPGDSIRAVVAFPVTLGTQVAIPAGTYVEGTLLPPAPKVKHQPDKGVQIHFTRLVFANGYSAPLDATQSAALAIPSAPSSGASPQRGVMALSGDLSSSDPGGIWRSIGFRLPSFVSGWKSWFMAFQATPPNTLPTPSLPKTGVPASLIAGLSVAVALPIILGLLFHHRAGNSDFIVHDAGWQFQMRIDAPLSLDTSLIRPKNP